MLGLHCGVLSGTTGVHQCAHGVLRLGRLRLQLPAEREILGGGLALLLDLHLRVLDLALLDREQGARGLELVEGGGLAVDQVADRLQLRGEVGRVLRLEHRPQPDQLRVGLLHALGGHLGEQPPLDLDLLAALAQRHLGLHQLALHLLVQRLGGGQLAPGDGQRRSGPVQLGPGGLQCAVGLGRGLRGVLQVGPGGHHPLLDLVLLVLEIVGVGDRHGGRSRGHGERDRGREDALPRGGGEVADHEEMPSFRGS